jgi:hypothetical protein
MNRNRNRKVYRWDEIKIKIEEEEWIEEDG